MCFTDAGGGRSQAALVFSAQEGRGPFVERMGEGRCGRFEGSTAFLSACPYAFWQYPVMVEFYSPHHLTQGYVY